MIVDIEKKINIAGLEPDQRLAQALKLARASNPTDAFIFLALYRMNSVPTRYLNLDLTRLDSSPRRQWYDYRFKSHDGPFRDSGSQQVLFDLANKAIHIAQGKKTLSTRTFLKALLDLCLFRGDNYHIRPYTLDMLLELSGLSYYDRLSEVTGVKQLLDDLASDLTTDEDFQYLISFKKNRIIFRIASTLGDFIQQDSSGVLRGHRAILTHFKENFGAFTCDEIQELEELLNSPSSLEKDFQDFFEIHTNFLRKWDHREVYPQVVLTHHERKLIPDFILTDRELQRAAIVELKLPGPKLIRRQINRDRFSAAIHEARTQLLRYRDWFRNSHNRFLLKSNVRMEIYDPQLIVIIGRSSEFQDEFDRQSLSADISDVKIVTYDDILRYAKRRRLIIQG